MNDLSISTLQAILPKTEELSKPSSDTSASPFKDYVMRSLADVNRKMLDADQSIQDLATGKNQDIHNTMIAMQKAEVSFDLIMQVRNKIVAAYDEIRKMSI